MFARENEGWSAYHEGRYENAIELAQAAIEEEPFVAEQWYIVKAKSELATGLYKDALKTLDEGLKKFPNEVGIRRVGIEVCRFNDDYVRASGLRMEIDELWKISSWRYRDPEELVAVGQNQLNGRVDAKTVLSRFFDKAVERNAKNAAGPLAIGFLALEKHDFTLAIENFSKATELAPDNPDAYWGLAKAYRESDFQASEKALEASLALNPHHANSLLLRVDHQINAEEFEAAQLTIDEILKTNASQPEAWAYRAALAHLQNQPKLEGDYRGKALKDWTRNPGVDHLIGKKLSQKYRFQESEAYQRRSLVYEPGYLPAKIQLAHDLLRLGQELEGWKLADEVFDKDQYSVVAHNLVSLRDHLSEFTTIESDGFVIRMDKNEAKIYGDAVVQLLQRASDELTTRYEVELELPVFVEIFPNQQDFAIRTFGLPGGQGFLGVCFGRVITMNSPAAQGSKLTNWQSVLWHEFCHVVTLQKTRNRMPRWLSEGISVYEERRQNPAWGQSLNSRYRKMIQQGDLTPLSQLSSAFLRPKSAGHLDFAYYESSLVVEFLVEKYGFDSLLTVLSELSFGTPINDALRRASGPVSVLDREFEQFTRNRIAKYSATGDWAEPDPAILSDPEETSNWESQHPQRRDALIALSRSQWKNGEFDNSIATAAQIIELYDDRESRALAYQLQIPNFRSQERPDQELAAIQRLVANDGSNVEACLRGIELATAKQDWKTTKDFCLQLLSIDPLIKQPHRALARAADASKDDSLLVRALRSLTAMDPLDAADIHYRLAKALHRNGNTKEARKHVLLALGQAPRFRDAHGLLLKIVNAEKQTAPEPGSSKPSTTNRQASGGTDDK